MFAKYWRKYTKDFLVGTFSQVLISQWSLIGETASGISNRRLTLNLFQYVTTWYGSSGTLRKILHVIFSEPNTRDQLTIVFEQACTYVFWLDNWLEKKNDRKRKRIWQVKLMKIFIKKKKVFETILFFINLLFIFIKITSKISKF